MANKVITNKKGGRALIRCDSNNTVTLASLIVESEIINGVTITQVMFSGSNTWSVARGANTVLELTGTNQFKFAASGISITEDSTGNLTITNPAADPGMLLIEVKKY